MVNDVNKAVFLDRDGVVNRPIIRKRKPYAPRALFQFKIYKDVKLSITKLIENNFLIIIVTNQPDIGNGLMKKKELDLIHKKLRSHIHIDEIYSCTHSQKEKCKCRKPSPFFLLKAKRKYNIDLFKSYFIGDRYTDMLTAKNANCRPVFIDRNYFETPFMDYVHYVKGIKQAINYILKDI